MSHGMLTLITRLLQAGKDKDGNAKVELQGPPVLDEGAIQLEDKHTWWPFMESGGGKLQRGSG